MEVENYNECLVLGTNKKYAVEYKREDDQNGISNARTIYQKGEPLKPNAGRDHDRRVAMAFLLSSHALSAFKSCMILSLLPCLTSLMLTLPVLTSLSSRKSKSWNSPSSLSSPGPDGNAESGTGGDAGLPRTDSAMRRRPSPSHSGPLGSAMRRDGGKWVFAQWTRAGSTGMPWRLRGQHHDTYTQLRPAYHL